MKNAFWMLTIPCAFVPFLHASPPAAPPPVSVTPYDNAVLTPAPGGRVFIFHGTGYIFSPGLKKMCADLRQAGLCAEDLPCYDEHWVCRRLIADHRAGRLSGPIIFVGHSRGARDALYAAAELEKAGIQVDLVVCLDVACPPPVPCNVGQVMNLYMTHNRIYPARPLQLAPGSAASIENVDLNGPGSPVDARGLIHVTVATNSSLQDLVVKRILQVASAPPAVRGR